MSPFVISTLLYNARYTLLVRTRNSHRPESPRIARWGGPRASGGRRHHAARDEKYLIEMFSFIYYSVSERCHLVQRRGEERTRGRGRRNRFRRLRMRRDLCARQRRRVQRPPSVSLRLSRNSRAQ